MKRYTARDESAGYISGEDKGLSLVGIYHITDWSEQRDPWCRKCRDDG